MLLATNGATWVHTTQQQQTAMVNLAHKTTEWCVHKDSESHKPVITAEQDKTATAQKHKCICYNTMWTRDDHECLHIEVFQYFDYS